VWVDAFPPATLVPFVRSEAEHRRDLVADVLHPRPILALAQLPQVDDGGNVLQDLVEEARGTIASLRGSDALGDLEAHRRVRVLELRGAGAHAELQLVVGPLEGALRD